MVKINKDSKINSLKTDKPITFIHLDNFLVFGEIINRHMIDQEPSKA